MSIWILHQRMTEDEEAHIFERKHLHLPFDGLPDLSQVSSPAQAMQLLRVLYPGEPPESLARRRDRFWNLFSGIQVEDIIAVPLKASRQVVLAEVTGRYQYDVGDKGSDIHLIPVKWYESRIPMGKFSKHKEIFLAQGEAMVEVTAQEARIAIRDKLPHKYNRFARWKWLLMLFFLMNILAMLTQGTHW